MAEKRQLLAEHQAIGRQVIHHQNPSWLAVLTGYSLCDARFLGLDNRLNGNLHTYLGALTRRTLQANRTVHQLYQLPANAQT
ncbi:hypothetical protein D3C76_1357040 [compost metagenome]